MIFNTLCFMSVGTHITHIMKFMNYVWDLTRWQVLDNCVSKLIQFFSGMISICFFAGFAIHSNKNAFSLGHIYWYLVFIIEKQYECPFDIDSFYLVDNKKKVLAFMRILVRDPKIEIRFSVLKFLSLRYEGKEVSRWYLNYAAHWRWRGWVRILEIECEPVDWESRESRAAEKIMNEMHIFTYHIYHFMFASKLR